LRCGNQPTCGKLLGGKRRKRGKHLRGRGSGQTEEWWLECLKRLDRWKTFVICGSFVQKIRNYFGEPDLRRRPFPARSSNCSTWNNLSSWLTLRMFHVEHLVARVQCFWTVGVGAKGFFQEMLPRPAARDHRRTMACAALAASSRPHCHRSSLSALSRCMRDHYGPAFVAIRATSFRTLSREPVLLAILIRDLRIQRLQIAGRLFASLLVQHHIQENAAKRAIAELRGATVQ